MLLLLLQCRNLLLLLLLARVARAAMRGEGG